MVNEVGSGGVEIWVWWGLYIVGDVYLEGADLGGFEYLVLVSSGEFEDVPFWHGTLGLHGIGVIGS